MALKVIILVVYLCIMFSCFISDVSAHKCNFQVKVKQILLGEGFHRNITYGIVFNADDERDKWLFHDCVLGLDQPLPPGVYANPDELVDLRRSRRLIAIPRNNINVELPAEDSQPNVIHLMETVKESKVYLWLPVHARYHRAAAGGGNAKNEIPPPKLFLRCPDQRLDMCDKAFAPIVTFLCNGSSKEKCSWRNIPYTMMTDKLSFDIPVGNTDHYYVVAGGTAAIIIIGSLYLIKSIHDYKIAETKKKYY